MARGHYRNESKGRPCPGHPEGNIRIDERFHEPLAFKLGMPISVRQFVGGPVLHDTPDSDPGVPEDVIPAATFLDADDSLFVDAALCLNANLVRRVGVDEPNTESPPAF